MARQARFGYARKLTYIHIYRSVISTHHWTNPPRWTSQAELICSSTDVSLLHL